MPDTEEKLIVKHKQAGLYIIKRASTWAEWGARKDALVMTRAEWEQELTPRVKALVEFEEAGDVTPKAAVKNVASDPSDAEIALINAGGTALAVRLEKELGKEPACVVTVVLFTDGSSHVAALANQTATPADLTEKDAVGLYMHCAAEMLLKHAHEAGVCSCDDEPAEAPPKAN